MAASRQNTPTEQNKEDNSLILYRLDRVEAAVLDVGSKVDKQDNIKRSDLKDFQDTIVTRFLDMKLDMQKQLDQKADSQELADFKKLVFGVIAFAQSLVLLILGYLIMNK